MNRNQRSHDYSRNRKRAKLVLVVLSLSMVSLGADQVRGQQPSRQENLASTEAENMHLDAFGYTPSQNAGSQNTGPAQRSRMRRLPGVTPESVTPQALASTKPLPKKATRATKEIPRADSWEKDSINSELSAGTGNVPSLPKPTVTVVSQKRSSNITTQTPIAEAAHRLAVIEAQRQHQPAPLATRWLQSITTSSCSERAAELLDDSSREYSVSAWASAESSAWEALELIARGIDVADRQTAATNQVPDAVANLQLARTAIREARDFVAAGGGIDLPRMEALAASHQTPVLAAGIPAGLTPAEAADRYLDNARKKLAGLASASVQAAKALDLLAAIGLARDKADWLPAETALCLRRAALQGQPSNSSLASRLGMQLADMGLEDEATWTLRHAISLDPDGEVAQALAKIEQRRDDKSTAMQLTADLRRKMPQGDQVDRIPEVIELSPSQFASISPAVNVGPSFQATTEAQPPVMQPPVSQQAVSQQAVSQQAVSQQAVSQQAVQATRQVETPKKRFGFLPASFAGFRLGGQDTPSDNDPVQNALVQNALVQIAPMQTSSGESYTAEQSAASYVAPAPSAIVPDASAWSDRQQNAWASSGISRAVGQAISSRSVPNHQPGQSNQAWRMSSHNPSNVYPAAAPTSDGPGYAAYPAQSAPAVPPSAVKRLIGKLPKLW